MGLECWDIDIEDLGGYSRLLGMLRGGEGVDGAFSSPPPVEEELFESVDVVNEFVVVTGGEWGIWVSGMLYKVTGVNMEGEALLEEVGQDGELIAGGGV